MTVVACRKKKLAGKLLPAEPMGGIDAVRQRAAELLRTEIEFVPHRQFRRPPTGEDRWEVDFGDGNTIEERGGAFGRDPFPPVVWNGVVDAGPGVGPIPGDELRQVSGPSTARAFGSGGTRRGLRG